MKKVSVLLASMFVVLMSCDKEEVEPNEPTPTTQNIGDEEYDKFVVKAEYGMDSVIFSSTGTSEKISPLPLTQTVCDGVERTKSEFPLSNIVNSGDECTVTIYHSAYPTFGFTLNCFVANSSTGDCDNLGGHLYDSDGGGSTTISFLAD